MNADLEKTAGRSPRDPPEEFLPKYEYHVNEYMREFETSPNEVDDQVYSSGPGLKKPTRRGVGWWLTRAVLPLVAVLALCTAVPTGILLAANPPGASHSTTIQPLPASEPPFVPPQPSASSSVGHESTATIGPTAPAAITSIVTAVDPTAAPTPVMSTEQPSASVPSAPTSSTTEAGPLAPTASAMPAPSAPSPTPKQMLTYSPLGGFCGVRGESCGLKARDGGSEAGAE